MEIATGDQFSLDDVPEWMWHKAGVRPGKWTIIVPVRSKGVGCASACSLERVVCRRVNLTESEFALLDKVVTNQRLAESKNKVFRAVVYQRAVQIWASGSQDHVAMRMLGPWAMSAWTSQTKHKFTTNACLPCFSEKQRVRLVPTVFSFARSDSTFVNGWGNGQYYPPADATSPPDDSGGEEKQRDPSSGTPAGVEMACPPRQEGMTNSLGYQREGVDYTNSHPCGGTDAEDSEIRAEVTGRIIVKDCGVGVVGQSTDDSKPKQVVGVVNLPIAVEPNVYAQEVLNAIKAIEERIDKKQRPFTGTEEDKVKVGRFVAASMKNNRNAPFSSKKIFDTIHTLTYQEAKSKKWANGRMENAIEALCQRIDPKFRLKAQVKLEPMPEGKAPRLLIADQDEGQVMALMTIYVIESLIKKHFPQKGIKGLSKKDAIKRVMDSCRVPKKVAKKLITVFEGDGSAWDTTCSATIRDWVENPIIAHVGKHVNAFLHSSPESWAEQHGKVCCDKTLTMSYTKNKEMIKLTIAAIRRSGHRGTSTLNWWMNFTCWHCAIFEDPEAFLNPDVKWGTDVCGTHRWLVSAFEGDDSFLTTSPSVTSQLDVSILQFWERIGFNMKIEKRDKHALFVGYRIALDECGPKVDDRGNYFYIPEVDRCMGRAGTSTSPDAVAAFKKDDKATLRQLSGTAAMSRAYEFAGVCPTISEKYLNYALSNGFRVDHDLKMRLNPDNHMDQYWRGDPVEETELVDSIRALNGMCSIEDEILQSTGFQVTDSEKNAFQDYTWDYDTLVSWEGFRDSLPATWRS